MHTCQFRLYSVTCATLTLWYHFLIRCLFSIFISFIACLYTLNSELFKSSLEADPWFNDAFFMLFNDYFPELVTLFLLVHSLPLGLSFYFIRDLEFYLFYLCLFLLYTILNIYFILCPDVLITIQSIIFLSILPYSSPPLNFIYIFLFFFYTALSCSDIYLCQCLYHTIMFTVLH